MRVMRLRAERVVWRRCGDEVIALDVACAEYLSFNRSGALLWEHLAACVSSDERTLAQLLIDAYGLDADRAYGDVAAFVSVMRDRAWLEG